MADATDTTQTQTDEAASERPFSLLDSLYPQPAEETPEPEQAKAEETEGEEEEDRESARESEQESEDEEVPISSVSELIEHNAYDPEWFNALKVPIKVDGKPAEATIQDLVASYQMKEAAERRLEEAKSKAKTVTQELAEKSEAVQGQFAVAAKMIERVEALVDRESSSVDWKRLREDDPAEYSAKKAELAERRQEIEQMKRDAAEDYRKATEGQWQETAKQQRERLHAEHAALIEKLPDWRDESKAAEEKGKLAKYLISQEFTEQDVMGASDHRLIVLARKAMLYDEGRTKVDAAKKRVAKVPKVMKPGTQKPAPKARPKDAADILYGG
jgi:hypothetical protein